MAALPLVALDQKPKAMAVDQKPRDVRHGEFVGAIYDSISNEEPYYLLPHYGRSKLFSMLGMMPDGYTITRYIYGTAKALLFIEDSVSWFGFIATRNAASDEEQGSPDVVVAIRGTLVIQDWIKNATASMARFEKVDSSAYVHKGFLSIYTSMDGSIPFGQKSMMDQIEQEVKRLADKAGKKLKVTVTGHSLGAALATLAAAHIGVKLSKQVKVSLCTFASPRVGDDKFKKLVEAHTEEILRYTTVGDQCPTLPPKVPKWVPAGWLPEYTHVGTEVKLDWTYSPYVDLSTWNFILCHNLELYLHQLAAEPNSSNPSIARPSGLAITNFAISLAKFSVDDIWKKNVGDSSEDMGKLESLKEIYKGDPESLQDYVQDVAYIAKKAKKAAKVEEEAKSAGPLMKRSRLEQVAMTSPYDKRDYSLLNKGANILKSEYRIPASWFVQPENKGMKLVDGKWLPRWKRPEEIPSPDKPDFYAEI